MLLYYIEGGGLVVLPQRNVGRMCRIVIFWTKLDEKLCLHDRSFN